MADESSRTVAKSADGATSAVLRSGGMAALASGTIGVVAVALLIAMVVLFAVGAESTARAVGWVNDLLSLVMYALAIPVALALHALLRPSGPRRSGTIAAVGVLALAAVVILQAILVVGAMTFGQQSVLVSIALLGVGVWLVATGVLGRSIGVLPHGLRNGLIGATYIGYPFWAIDLGRRLRHLANEGLPRPGVGAAAAPGAAEGQATNATRLGSN